MIGITVAVVHSVSVYSFQNCFLLLYHGMAEKQVYSCRSYEKGAQRKLRTDNFRLFCCDTAIF